MTIRSLKAIVAVFAGAVVLPGAAPAATCGDESALKSPPETTASDITFRNPAAEKRRIYWIDFDGKRKFYATIEPGQLLKQRTYVGHNWVVANDAETCLFIVSASAAPITVDLGESAPAAPPAGAPVPPLPQTVVAAAPAATVQPPPAASAVTLPLTAVVSPVGGTSPVERYRLDGRYRLMSRTANGKSINNQDSGIPELAVTQVQWDSSHWEFQAVPGTEFVWIKNSWKDTYLVDDRGKPKVLRTPADDQNGQWAMEAVDGEPYVRIKSRGGAHYLVAGHGQDIYLDSRIASDRDGHWQFIPTAWPRPVNPAPAPRVVRQEAGDDDKPVKHHKKDDSDDDDDARDHGFKNAAARDSARASCKETGGYWTGETCKAAKHATPGKCKTGYAWSEDAGACQFDGGDPAPKTNNANIDHGNCGPGFISQNGKCISQGNGKSTPEPKLTAQQKINKGIELLNAFVKNCPKGQVWTKGEGCHQDD